MKRGGSLYGLGADCGEWVVTPKGTEKPESQDGPGEDEAGEDEAGGADADAEAATDEADDVAEVAPAPDDGRLRGHFETRSADAEGKLHGFSYAVTPSDDGVLRAALGGRGWHPAPGVLIPSEEPGMFTIGSASYCIEDAGIRAHPTERAALVVERSGGPETWYLTREACVAARGPTLAALRGCGK